MPEISLSSADIILTTLNARYIHSAFGLRYLYANLGELQKITSLDEFTIHERPLDIAEKLLNKTPRIIGFSVYIWNINEVTQTVALLKQIAPKVMIVLGGPEVSHIPDQPEVADLADYVVKGAGEISFRLLCEQILQGIKPLNKVIDGDVASLDKLVLPYTYYNEEDIRNRIIYVEASRGCPFKCEFCLSSLDKTSKPFELSTFLDEIDVLYQRGARNFKFIDRTFNLKVATSVAILEFFLERMTDDLYLHFEVIPDNLPDKLKQVLVRFPPESLQFEIGVQTFDSEIQNLISRRQDNDKTCENLRWLRENTGAHLHTDLIFGLPQDTLDNFAKSFDLLVSLKPQEIQMGILKRLRGAPINRHTDEYQLRYNPLPPYNILSTRDIDFITMQRVNRFARYWDMIANSGRFIHTLPYILADKPFERFMQLSDGLYAEAGSTWKIALKRLFDLIYTVMTLKMVVNETTLKQCLKEDYQRSGQSGLPAFLQDKRMKKAPKVGVANKRQSQHSR
ncbi:MAG: B12-binding domain-containing radical SAM protein [Aquificaceae bacterium]|nr:MAG: B12-binding domain-containing radical SAM protein [Aquificaceae bacterium]